MQVHLTLHGRLVSEAGDRLLPLAQAQTLVAVGVHLRVDLIVVGWDYVSEADSRLLPLVQAQTLAAAGDDLRLDFLAVVE